MSTATGTYAMTLFPTTQWTHVAEAGDSSRPGADAALAELCRCYWYPIYSFIRSRGHGPDAAADLTQDYFARLLGGRLLAAADHRKGRFRSLLLADCAYFLADWGDRGRTLKRGGAVRVLSIDGQSADHRYHLEPSDRLGPDHLFDRAWALEVLSRSLAQLANEEAEAGRGEMFEHLRGILVEGDRSSTHALLAERLGTTEAAVEGAARRLRKRFRLALRRSVAETLHDPTELDIDDEIRDLFRCLSR